MQGRRDAAHPKGAASRGGDSNAALSSSSIPPSSLDQTIRWHRERIFYAGSVSVEGESQFMSLQGYGADLGQGSVKL